MMRIPRHVLGWFLIGVATATFLLVTQAMALGGVAGLLQVGETSELRPVIEQQLGPIPLVPGGGHDGQVSYAIGLDLDLSDLSDEVGEPGYRHRRILFPLVASLGGLLEGRALLYGMVATAAVGMGLATSAMADLAGTMGLPKWIVAGVLANPGAWLAVRVVTPDALALGLVISALAAYAKGNRRSTIVLLTLAALTKDQSLVAAIALAADQLRMRRYRQAAFLVTVPTLALGIWSAAVSQLVGDGFTPRGNLDLPFVGMFESFGAWQYAPGPDVALGALMIAVTVVGLLLAMKRRNSWVGFQLWAWSGLAVLSSFWVWEYGNNAARVFSPLIAVVAIGLPFTNASKQESPSVGGPEVGSRLP
jgi:hypothetical protein